MDNYGNPYPYPYGYPPPPNPDPYHPPPPRYLHPSNSFSSPPINPDPQFNHSDHSHYQPPSPDPYYNPYAYPHPQPYPYPYPHHSISYDSYPNSPSFNHVGSSRYEPTASVTLPSSYPPFLSDNLTTYSPNPGNPSLSARPSSTDSPSSSSTYPLADLLANIRLSDQRPTSPSIAGSHYRPSTSFSGSFPQAPPPLTPQTSFSGPLAPYGGSQHGCTGRRASRWSPTTVASRHPSGTCCSTAASTCGCARRGTSPTWTCSPIP